MKPSHIIPPKPAFEPYNRYDRVAKLWGDYPLRTDQQSEDYIVDVFGQLIKALPKRPTQAIMLAAHDCMYDLACENRIFQHAFPIEYCYEEHINPDVELSLVRADAFKAFHLKELAAILSALSGLPLPTSAIGTVPLIDILKRQKDIVGGLVGSMLNAEAKPDMFLFPNARQKVAENIKVASGLRATSEIKNFDKIVYTDDSDLSGIEFVDAYLGGTPWADFLKTPVPFDIPLASRLEHTVIVGGSGHGKSQLLQQMILSDLDKPDPPSLIVLDSTGQMVDRIQRLAVFSERLRDRLLIIDPAHSPALNMFDVSTARFNAYTPEQQEDVQSEIISLFNYIFSSDDYDLTSRQGTAFAYAVKLIVSRKGSTITQLRQLLEEELPKGSGYSRSAFKDDIDKLDEDTRDFFTNHFYSAGFGGTRLQIAQRLHKVIGVPAFRRMFTSGTNTLDLFSDMQKGTIVLVNTNQQLLKEESYVLFGRYIVARALAAAFERATIPEAQRRPAFLIVDESAPYFDQTFESLLTRVRQFKLGVVIAFQHLEQTSAKLQSAIASSTSVKFAGGVGFTDRRWLSREMATSPEFIDAQKKDRSTPPTDTRFAVYVRNSTDHALSLTVPFGVLENRPRMPDDVHAAMLRANLMRVAPAPTIEKPPEPPTPPPIQEAKLPPPFVPDVHAPKPSKPIVPTADDDDLPTTWGNGTIKR